MTSADDSLYVFHLTFAQSGWRSWILLGPSCNRDGKKAAIWMRQEAEEAERDRSAASIVAKNIRRTYMMLFRLRFGNCPEQVISQHERYLAAVEEGAFLAKGSEAE